MLKEALYYARMGWRYARFIKMAPIPDPTTAIRENLARREENFLNLARRGVFENSRSPYHRLFALANCDFEDLSCSVQRKGLETTLKDLREAGVYLTHEEVKGKPVRRHGQEIPNDIAATANPGSSKGIESVSSGSRSRSTATPTSNEYRLYRECYENLAHQAFGAENCASGSCGRFCPILAPWLQWSGSPVPAARGALVYDRQFSSLERALCARHPSSGGGGAPARLPCAFPDISGSRRFPSRCRMGGGEQASGRSNIPAMWG